MSRSPPTVSAPRPHDPAERRGHWRTPEERSRTYRFRLLISSALCPPKPLSFRQRQTQMASGTNRPRPRPLRPAKESGGDPAPSFAYCTDYFPLFFDQKPCRAELRPTPLAQDCDTRQFRSSSSRRGSLERECCISSASQDTAEPDVTGGCIDRADGVCGRPRIVNRSAAHQVQRPP
jgi:hypothetical protein